MQQKVLIGEPCEILRIGLRTIFLKDAHVSHIYEAATPEDMETQLRNCAIDMVVVNQLLLTDLSLLPRGKFIVLTAKPDVTILMAVYKHGARGYVSEMVSAELIRMIFCAHEDSFLIEPVLTPWVMEYIFRGAFAFFKEKHMPFTALERELIALLSEGLNSSTHPTFGGNSTLAYPLENTSGMVE